jgi:hypothetical protein
MQSLQQEIKKDIISHPFRNIEIIYEVNKTTLTPQDEELLFRYIGLHDLELRMQNTADNLCRQSLLVNDTLESLQEELKMVEASLDVCIDLADKLSEENYVTEETSINKLHDAREETLQKLNEYNVKIVEAYEAAKAIQDSMNDHNAKDESAANALCSEFSNLTIDHLANESNAINPVAFDNQFDQFREYACARESQREDLLNTCDEMMNNYTKLNLQTTTLYNTWNEFSKRYDLLIKIYLLHNKVTGFTEN